MENTNYNSRYPIYPYISGEQRCYEQPLAFPEQKQDNQPGMEYLMQPAPIFENPNYRAGGKLAGKTALISGGDSGIGRAVAVAFAKEGANISIVYLDEHRDANETKQIVEGYGAQCILLPLDLRVEQNNIYAVERTVETFGDLNILVNNAGVQYVQDRVEDISTEQLHDTFVTNVYSYFYITKAAMKYLKDGDSIINTSSIVAYAGEDRLIDYAATKGAVVSYTRSLAKSLVAKGIRVNSVAPGFFWSPLQPASWNAEDIPTFGVDTPMKRAGQPFELAPAYVFLACDDSRYVTGQTIHVNGGEWIGG